MAPLLQVKDLEVQFQTIEGTVHAVNGISYNLYTGQTLGIVGESGCWKSVSVLTVMGLIPEPPGKIAGGEVIYHGEDLLKMDKHDIQKIRGREIAMVFQDPMTSLNPVFTVANQVAEAIKDLILSYLNSQPSIKYLVLVGDDLMIPFYRVPDDAYIANESTYTGRSGVDSDNPTHAALDLGYTLSDDFYADHTPLKWRGRELYVPDLAIGRLVETPAEIETMIQAFLNNDPLSPTTVQGRDKDGQPFW